MSPRRPVIGRAARRPAIDRSSPRADARRDAIREILAASAVATQDQLRRRLRSRGIEVAQATLSRDLRKLGVKRASGSAAAHYEIPGDRGALPIDPVRRLVEAVDTNGLLVIVRTKAGAASTVARALDDARLPEALGTIAGDDTIFVAPKLRTGAGRLTKRLRSLLGLRG